MYIELDELQLDVLNRLASGQTRTRIANELSLSEADVKSIELDIRARLDAKTAEHMVSRAWQFGLFTRALCLVLALVCTLQMFTPTPARLPSRTRTNIVRVLRLKKRDSVA
ncbi:helix-turn-helix transcriptional regulator [Salinivibrio socompensis]|uniref:helix-turn-helix transcriptional regulator n=1 Tax=Salinivibrio socompensis TaxID=1510206 RepID=UPI00046F0518|nr:helix-turn-helix transcriptional regulator [Salinivibrio socompensis]